MKSQDSMCEQHSHYKKLGMHVTPIWGIPFCFWQVLALRKVPRARFVIVFSNIWFQVYTQLILQHSVGVFAPKEGPR
jgi:hypothetical protein